MPTMRFKSTDGLRVIRFDSQPANSICLSRGYDPKKFELRNERTVKERKVWDVWTCRESEKKLAMVGTLEYLAPEWPGGPARYWND
jgi:hypothetical protein